jgi:hypothetical protein
MISGEESVMYIPPPREPQPTLQIGFPPVIVNPLMVVDWFKCWPKITVPNPYPLIVTQSGEPVSLARYIPDFMLMPIICSLDEE